MTSPGVQECALCASSAYHVHHASICANVVIGVLVVLCELHVTRVVVVDAVESPESVTTPFPSKCRTRPYPP